MSVVHSPPESIPLSFNQEFLCIWDQGDGAGPFGPRYHLVHGWRVRGEIHVDALRGALYDLVERHETLRTVLAPVEGGGRVPRLFPPSEPQLVLRDLAADDARARDRAVEQLLIEVESGTISSHNVPLIRAILGRFDNDDAVLIIIVHHTATDGWSMRVTMRDLAELYAARRGHPVDLPKAPAYREYAAWQREHVADPANSTVDIGRGYWRDQLTGAQIFTLPTDHPRSAGLGQETAVFRFRIGEDIIGPALALAKATRSSPFMMLLAGFYVLAARMTGTTDISVPTFSPGRTEQFERTVGSFFNFLPMRAELAGCATFREAVRAARVACLDAYSHDIPSIFVFGEAPELMRPAMQDGRATVVFQAFPFPFLMDRERVGDVEYTEVRRRLIGQPVGCDVPDGMLWTLNVDPTGDVIGSVQFRSGLFTEHTVRDMVSRYTETLRDTVLAPDAPLRLA